MQPLLQDQFGRVFVRTANGGVVDTLTNTKNFADDYALLEGGQFSNLQLRIQFDDKLVDNSFTGKRFSVGFQGHLLNIPFSLGSSPVVDPQIAETCYEQMLNAAKGMGLINENRDGHTLSQQKCKLIRDTAFHILFCLATAGNETEDGGEFFPKALLLVYLDDIQERMGDYEQNPDDKTSIKNGKKKCRSLLPYSVSCQVARFISNVLTADHDDDDDDCILENLSLLCDSWTAAAEDDDDKKHVFENSAMSTKTFNWIKDMTLYCTGMRNAALKTGRRNGISSAEFLHAMAESLGAFFLEYSWDWKVGVMGNEAKAKALLPSLVSLRRATACARPFLEAVLLHLGAHVSDTVRGTKVFQMICGELEIHVQKVNDLLSFDKEMRGEGNEWRNNEACMLHKVTGMTVEDAKGKLANEANVALRQIEMLSSLLLRTWSQGSKEKCQAERLVQIVKQVLVGHIQYYAFAHRYLTNLVMDCYVE